MLLPGRHPLRIIAGADFDFTFRLTHNGQPDPLPGTLRLVVVKTPGGDPMLVLGPSAGVAIDADGDWVTFFAYPAATAELPAGSYLYAVEWTSVSGHVSHLLAGPCTVERNAAS